jgi:hypothetical protein
MKPVGGSTPGQLTSRHLTVHECWIDPCTVELRPNAQGTGVPAAGL